MTTPKAAVIRPDKRVGAKLETLAFLFDVSVSTVERAIAAGKIEPSRKVFGVPLYHVETVEKAVFGGDAPQIDATVPPETGVPANLNDDPYIRAIHDAAKTEKRRGTAA